MGAPSFSATGRLPGDVVIVTDDYKKLHGKESRKGFFPCSLKLHKGVSGEGDNYEKNKGAMVVGLVGAGVSWMFHGGQ
ncbi:MULTISPECIES: hypothetical protein [unclassified Pseudomonas]|uniref:hypothetical protein n=1 Tax=unclassified Pseudomonas TaxID=196821 RepID=UPI00156EC9CF|nr:MULTISPECIES: hypothetical protein [unclassified Pseudomonas]